MLVFICHSNSRKSIWPVLACHSAWSVKDRAECYAWLQFNIYGYKMTTMQVRCCIHENKRKILHFNSKYPWQYICFVCLFGVFRPTWESFTHIKTSTLQRRAANFDLDSALMAIEQWGFFNVPHPLCHRPSVFKVISEDPWHSHLMSSIWQWTVTSCFNNILNANVMHRHVIYKYHKTS